MYAMKSTKKTKPFHENLLWTFLFHSVVPSIVIIILCIISFACIWNVSVATKNKKVNKEIANTLNRTFSDYEEWLCELSQNASLVTKKMSMTKRQNIIKQLYTVGVKTTFQANLYIIDREYEVCLSSEGELEEDIWNELSSNWSVIRRLNENQNRTCFYIKKGSNKKIYIGRAILDQSDILGYAIIAMDSKEMNSLLSNSFQNNIIADTDGWIYAASNVSYIDSLGRIHKEYLDKSGFYANREGHYYITNKTIWNQDLVLYTITDNTHAWNIFRITTIAVGIVIIIFLFITFQSTKKISIKSTKDIRTLSDAFHIVTNGNLESYLTLHSSTEFEEIGTHFNTMLDSLKSQIARNRELAEHVANAQIKQLQSQFQSHFLFNTLNNIRYMCKIDPDLAETMIVSLSGLLRYSISNANEDVTVEEDFSYINEYLRIIKFRFPERFTYEIKLEESIKQCYMPKLLLQSLIENSVKYGFGDREQLTIRLSGFRKESYLVFCCEDDGVGMSKEKLHEIQTILETKENTSNHLGLYNVSRRIRLLYGESAKFQIQSDIDCGVQIMLHLPLTKGEGSC